MLVPLGLVTWLGVRMVKEVTAGEQRRIDDQLTAAQRSELEVIRESVMRVLADFERDFADKADEAAGMSTEELREMVRGDSRVRQIFVLDAQRMFVYPPEEDSQRTSVESEFFERIAPVWNKGEPLYLERTKEADFSTNGAVAPSTESDWFSWFWADGVQHVFWKRHPDGSVTGIEADRMSLMAAVIGNLPLASAESSGLRVLGDVRGRTIYKWGDAALSETGAAPSVEVALGDPLSMWRLKYFADLGNDSVAGNLGERAVSGMITAVGLAAALVLLLAVYFYREHNRQLRDAEQRVSFVNQVSHELKTPLTNIRMYTELAGERVETLDEEDTSGARKFLDIVTDESQRLSRLISNVLAYAKEQRGEVTLQPRKGTVDTVIASSLEMFRPALEKRGIEVEFDAQAKGEVMVDSDALGQIIANLISNVEKYADSGKWLRIASRNNGAMSEICVEDRGPGIPRGQREKVFQAFARVSDQVSDGVTGTGIGLGIARTLARLHGGDLVLTKCQDGGGCRFVLTLETPEATI